MFVTNVELFLKKVYYCY